MNTVPSTHRTLAIATLVVLAGVTLAPLAQAGHRGGRGAAAERRVLVRRVYRPVPTRVVPYGSYTVWHSGSGPVVAGFLGGLFLGATLAHAAPQGFVYWDPYCQQGFASLELYDSHCSWHHHPNVIHVVETTPGCDPRDADLRDRDDRGDWEDDE